MIKNEIKMTAFEEFGVIPELGKAVDEMEWLLPTDVQAEAIPLILGGLLSRMFISQFLDNLTGYLRRWRCADGC